MPKVTRVNRSKNLNQGKYDALQDIAQRLGKVRGQIWRDYGSLRGVGLHYGVIAKEQTGGNVPLGLTYKLWKNTVKDVVEDIATYRAAAKVHVRRTVWQRFPGHKNKQVRIDLFTPLKYDNWLDDPFLRRQMREHYRHGRTRVDNQIVLESAMYTSFEHNGRIWLKVQSLERGQRMAIPTDANKPFTGNLRLILRDGVVEIHHTRDEADVCSTKPCGAATIGIDKGYSEAFTDSDGDRHGDGLGEILSNESDYLKAKYQARNKLKALAEKHDQKNPEKAENIRQNNLGRKKLNRRKRRQTARIRDKVYKAAHAVVDKAETIVCEDLTSPIKDGKTYGQDQSRRLAGWVKGTMAGAIQSVSNRRGSSVVLVNAAYTSQIDSTSGLLLGTRSGDRFYRVNGDVLDADTNAARNILARLYDNEIQLYTPYREVKAILRERTALCSA